MRNSEQNYEWPQLRAVQENDPILEGGRNKPWFRTELFLHNLQVYYFRKNSANVQYQVEVKLT